MLRVLVVDDRVDVRQVFAAVLDGQPDLEVVGQADSLADASAMLEGVAVGAGADGTDAARRGGERAAHGRGCRARRRGGRGRDVLRAGVVGQRELGHLPGRRDQSPDPLRDEAR